MYVCGKGLGAFYLDLLLCSPKKKSRRGEPSGCKTSVCSFDLVESVAGAAKDVFDFVADEFFDLGPGGREILARIEFFRVIEQHFADGSSHGETQVGVDIDLGATDPTSDFDICFRNTRGVLAHFATVFINFRDEVLRH